MPRLEGAFSTVVMTKDSVVAFRDGAGLRPLSLGQLGDRYCVASESCAFDIIGAELLREVQPGEMVSLGERGIETRQLVESRAQGLLRLRAHLLRAPRLDPRGQPHPGLAAQDGRDPLARGAGRGRRGDRGARLRQRRGAPATRKASGIPRDDGLIKNRYVARTFIQPGQELRKHGLRMKFNPLREVVEGKRLVVVDDSIVRGNTTRQIVQMLRDAGRRRDPHADLGPADPPPLPLRDRHVHDAGDGRPRAHRRGDRRASSDCDSLAYLSLDGVYEAIRSTRETHCDACFSGDYPLERTEDGERQVRARGARGLRQSLNPRLHARDVRLRTQA